MNIKRLITSSKILTALTLLATDLMLMFGLVVALNGFPERKATIALVISILCQGLGLILGTVLAARLTRRVAQGANAHSVVAVLVGVGLGVAAGTAIAIVGILAAILIAEGL